ncbi:MAG: phospholipase [Rhodospirillaceae bacterium]|jgi:phospholipase/carboxylesterase|nr:phospholipase [Rhodospirillaceae bacterium]MBT5667072.1 phospholipase [Rhodospirillaceae bacterium]MBT5811877.1 phospholipase [Rhodospirillaceae bacterium]
MSDDNEERLDVITAILPPLLHSMEALIFLGRYLHPPQLTQLIDHVGTPDTVLRTALADFRKVDWPDRLIDFSRRIGDAGGAVCEAFEGLRTAESEQEGMAAARRAMRRSARAAEALYPLASLLPPISQFFLEESARGDAALEARLNSPSREGDAPSAVDGENSGVIHAKNDRDARGGFSLYVPETYEAANPHPLIIALHGGHGHGRLFLWSWIREARTRGAILLSPTSFGDTWSLMEPDVDVASLNMMLDQIGRRWNIDPTRILLTGMSDGGTFTYIGGLRTGVPFTHLAPMSSGFHPMLLEGADQDRIAGLPVYIVHGALDWMFPPDTARETQQALAAKGAKVVYREVPDLSHAHARDENAGIMDWFLSDT